LPETQQTNPRNHPKVGEYSNVDFKAIPQDILDIASVTNKTVQFVFLTLKIITLTQYIYNE
jgi:hypothetical protein